jgi:hypothetical protein
LLQQGIISFFNFCITLYTDVKAITTKNFFEQSAASEIDAQWSENAMTLKKY